MRALVFIHGIIGARMELGGQEIWPPTFTEYQNGYTRIEELLNPNTVATGVVDRFMVIEWPFPIYVNVYAPILNDLKYIAENSGSITEFVHYDWRQSNWKKGTEVLASAMKRAEARGATSITLICHSMGGLIGRLMLETDKYKNEGWMKKIEQALFVCTPHIGAAKPLGLALGFERYFGIGKEDMKRLLGDARYPAGYECMPDESNEVLYDAHDPKHPVPQNIYLPAVDEKYGLTISNIDSLKTLRGLLNYENRPKHVPYLLVGGTGHKTHSSFFYKEPPKPDIRTSDGDGTVVISSALPSDVGLVKKAMPGEHLDIIKTDDFKDFLYSTLGVQRPPKIMIDGRPRVIVSLQKGFASPGEQLSVLLIPDGATTEISGSLKLSKVVADPRPSLVNYRTVADFLYKGTPVTHLPSHLTAPSDPGVYRVEFEGSHRSGEDGAAILVVD